MELFTGPGKYLVLPQQKVTNPECNSWDGDYGNPDKPPCICIYPRMEVPFGYWYTRTPHDEIIRPWNQKEAQEWLTKNEFRHKRKA